MDIEQLKSRIDLHDLAEKLGLERPRSTGNYRSPHHKDKQASLSIFQGGKRWKDHSTGEGGGCIDLVMYVEDCEFKVAFKRLHDLYGFPMDRPERSEGFTPRQRTLPELIAERSLQNPDLAIEYLRDKRKISEETIKRAIKAGAIGFNSWNASMRAPKPGQKPLEPGEPGYGGPAVVFVVRSLVDSQVQAVEMRYLDPEMNGGVKTQTQGTKENAPWFVSRAAVQAAETVVLVEAPINALSVDDCKMRKTVGVAVRGVGNVDSIDWRFLQGKRVIIAMDNDEPRERDGKRAGLEAAWTIYDQLTALGIAAHIVDQLRWKESDYNDPNDILQKADTSELKKRLLQFDPGIIPGQPAGDPTTFGNPDVDTRGRTRVFLPPHDHEKYWRYRAKEDFTTHIEKWKQDDDGSADPQFEDVCGMRVAAITRVTVPGAVATMTGDPDTQPQTLFSVSVQTPDMGNTLVRKVFEPERLYNAAQWTKLGTVFNVNRFLRMLNILVRGADHGARTAINLVGLGWREGKPIMNEGPDTYFQEPHKQCAYHNLTFPAGTREDARTVISWYHKTFHYNAALQLLAWSVGSHLKAFTGFWPHMVLQADKGAGKSVLTTRLSRTIAMTMFSGQSLQTDFRMLTTVSGTTQPVGWEELSARRSDLIDKAVALLQEAYAYTITRRGPDLHEFLISAPVLLAGEDVPVDSLTGKTVAVFLAKQGPMMPDDMPRFPMRQWLQYLAGLSKDAVRETYGRALRYCQDNSRSPVGDKGADRMLQNYTAVLTSWYLMADFAQLDATQFDFQADLVAQMNAHIAETSHSREPWIWIVEKLLSEIAAREFRYPYKFDTINGHLALCVRTSHVMDHLKHSPRLKEFINACPVKSDRVFKRQLKNARVIVENDRGEPMEIEKTINRTRYGGMTPLDVEQLEALGMSVPIEDGDSAPVQSTWFPKAAGDR